MLIHQRADANDVGLPTLRRPDNAPPRSQAPAESRSPGHPLAGPPAFICQARPRTHSSAARTAARWPYATRADRSGSGTRLTDQLADHVRRRDVPPVGAGHNLVTGVCQVGAYRAPWRPAVHPWGGQSAAPALRRGGSRELSAAAVESGRPARSESAAGSALVSAAAFWAAVISRPAALSEGALCAAWRAGPAVWPAAPSCQASWAAPAEVGAAASHGPGRARWPGRAYHHRRDDCQRSWRRRPRFPVRLGCGHVGCPQCAHGIQG